MVLKSGMNLTHLLFAKKQQCVNRKEDLGNACCDRGNIKTYLHAEKNQQKQLLFSLEEFLTTNCKIIPWQCLILTKF